MRVGVDIMGITTHIVANTAFRYVISLTFYVVGIAQYSEIGHWQVETSCLGIPLHTRSRTSCPISRDFENQSWS